MNLRASRVREVIEVTTAEGSGEQGDPCREVVTYLDPASGAFLAVFDPLREAGYEPFARKTS